MDSIHYVEHLLMSAKPEHPWLVLGGILLFVIFQRLTVHDPLHDIPGPWLAKYTSLLLAYHARGGKRHLYVDSLHKKYGPFVRITPNQVSCAHPNAPAVVYAQGSASLPKTQFYRAFYVDGTASLFSTQDRAGHSSKRRVLAHPFSYASVRQFEGWIRRSVGKMASKLDEKVRRGGGLGINAATVGRASGSCYGTSQGEVDVLMWLNYLTVDVISDLAFGEPLGMLDRGTDVIPEEEDGGAKSDATKRGIEANKEYGVAAMIDYRGRTAAILGLFPYLLPGSILAPLARWIPDPDLQRGLQGTDNLSKIARRCVKHRLQSNEVRRGDLLDRLIDDMRNKQGLGQTPFDDSSPLSPAEMAQYEADVVTDAMLLLTAGSDTTANSTAAILFWIYATPRVLRKLREELDEMLAGVAPSASDLELVKPMIKEADDESVADILQIPLHDQVKDLKYLNAAIDEGLRMFATNAFGLPRVVPEGMSVNVEGHTFYEGTELSCPAYTIQHDPAIWGPDADTFRPERWLEESASGLKKHLLTFGIGPRACIGKNLAILQVQILVATFVSRYDLVLRDPKELRSVEGFMHKPTDLWAKVYLRGEGGLME
ncbi:hypothetical protein D9613_008961 [Agrocybe pediades]|uniref:Cytochrome P450 n=1 Tax=Agrocybe pediades TaxID=84607 RepID=A0A8H4VU30_9AGAR|nr:hypothetical protein D9613_008961 [Agrocybe pediades]